MASKFTISTIFSAVDKMTGPIGQMGAKVSAFGQKVAKSTNASGQLVKALSGIGAFAGVAGGAALAAGAGIFKLATHAQEAADSINDTSNALGISTKALQEYRYIAKLSGMETADMDVALQKLTINLGKGGKEVETVFEKLGTSSEELKAMAPDKRLEAIADGMKNIKDPTEKAAIATQIFGKSSVRMVNALSSGSEGLAELRQEAQATGYVMNDMAINAGAHLGDTLDRLKLTSEGLLNRLGEKFLPMVDKMATAFQKSLQPGGALDGVLSGIVEIIGTMGPVFDKIMPTIGKAVTKLGSVFAKLMKAVSPVLEGIFGLFDALIGPIMEVVEALVVALSPVFETFGRALAKIAPIIGKFAEIFGGILSKALKMIGPILDSLYKSLDPIFNIIMDLLGPIFDLAGVIMVSLAPAFQALAPILKPVADLLGKISELLKPIMDAVGWAVNKIGFGVGTLTDVIGGKVDIGSKMGAFDITSRDRDKMWMTLQSMGVKLDPKDTNDILKWKLAKAMGISTAELEQYYKDKGKPMEAETSAAFKAFDDALAKVQPKNVVTNTTTNNNSNLTVDFKNVPGGTTLKQDKPAPGINLNMGGVGSR